MDFRLFTLGTLRLVAGDSTVTGPASQRRRLALLALLAVAGERGLSRDKVIAYLWPEQSTSRGRHLLSEALYVIRKALGDSTIVATQDELRLNEAKVWSDVAAFRSDASSAIDLYKGPFLDGFYLNDAGEFQDWVEQERVDLATRFGRALESAAEAASQSGDHVTAAQSWARLAYHEPFSARVALRYMQALADAGDRGRAIQHAAAFAERSREELGIEPDASVLALVARLQRADASVGSAPVIDLRVPHEDEQYGLSELAPEFDVVRSIGAGSVAEVFLARETSLKRLVAIKVLRPEHASVESGRKRFEREAQSAARIEHPNVATAYRFGRLSSGIPYIVMPYINGGSLEDRLAATGPWSVAHSSKQLVQIAAGLAAAHRLGIVHRDVRPGNILYHRDSDRVLLTDFGLAAVLDTGDASAALRLTMPGELLGSIAYSSPEQLRGDQVTERADVYSLGVVAFEMVTGELPFKAKSHAQMLLAQTTEVPRLASDVIESVDAGFAGIVARCLNKRPEQRPYAAELVEVLTG